MRQVQRTRRRGEAGFTLTELIVTVVIIGVLSAIAVFGARRPIAETELDKAAGAFNWALNSARQRSLATHLPYLIEISAATGFRFCAALPDYSACNTAGEVSVWSQVGEKVVLNGYARSTILTGTTGASAFTSATVRVGIRPDGSIDGDPATTTLEGFTIYLRTDDSSKLRKAYVYPLTGQHRITDAW